MIQAEASKVVKLKEQERTKRSREHDDDDNDDDEDQGPRPLTGADKTYLKSVINRIMKLEDFAAFHFPVDREQYPEYYKLTKHPMDLSTLKEELMRKYETLEEFTKRASLIWKNCKAFNAVGSEIYENAEEVDIFVCFPMNTTIQSNKYTTTCTRTHKPSHPCLYS